MDKLTFTDNQLTEIYFALGDRVNQLTKSRGWLSALPDNAKTSRYHRLVDRQLEHSEKALATVIKIIEG